MAHVVIVTDDKLWGGNAGTRLLAPEHNVRIATMRAAETLQNLSVAETVIIVDTEVVGADFGNITPLIRQGFKLLAVGANWQPDRQINALVAGCYGYCDIGAAPELLPKAVDCILRGDIWIPRHLAPRIIGLLAKLEPAPAQPKKHGADCSKNIEALTQRERDVAKMLGEGLSNKLIASLLNISERTVKAHLTSIFQKLKVQDRLQLALLIRDHI